MEVCDPASARLRIKGMKAQARYFDETGNNPILALMFPMMVGEHTDNRACVTDRPRTSARVVDIAAETDIKNLTHEQLMTRVAEQRDKSAFKLLFVYFAPRLKAHLMSMGVTAEVAEDLMQEVLIKVWRKAHQFQSDKAKLSTWMFRIARNAFIDYRRRAKYPEVNADDHLHHMQADDETDRPVMEGQTAERVSKAIEALKPKYKEVIHLSFFEELSHSQIAERLELPLGTVKSRIRLAFGAMRSELGEMG
ncbi:RNA polymerase sigma-70 factor, ECF subfamily [Kordiimonas lacus]|uniref:RNA polymerase sigma-70 factor, ECF subfamily n=3 Tax=Kordiimonadaceae TaxID=1331809 RepID=A0A1G6ZEE8_9PROT|nr:RNA polymerase sigma-70 factor, ECF subfamily [Kordiimonas lacus]